MNSVNGNNFTTRENGGPDAAILVGTSGYSYDDWVGHFYPKGTKKSDFLSYYSDHFRTVEINYTYYRMPSEKSIEGMVNNSEGKVEFVLKLHQDMTHNRSAGSEHYKEFLNAVRPMSEAGVFGAFLAQFPYSFHPTQKNTDYIKRLRDFLPEDDVVVELRNSKWVKQSTFELLKNHNLGYCCVDEPKIKGLMPDIAVATSKTGYVRFHGRNAAKWYDHDKPAERYDYRYSKEELEPWVGRIKRLAAMSNKVYCFHNNHYQSKAVDSAQLLLELLK